MSISISIAFQIPISSILRNFMWFCKFFFQVSSTVVNFFSTPKKSSLRSRRYMCVTDEASDLFFVQIFFYHMTPFSTFFTPVSGKFIKLDMNRCVHSRFPLWNVTRRSRSIVTKTFFTSTLFLWHVFATLVELVISRHVLLESIKHWITV